MLTLVVSASSDMLVLSDDMFCGPIREQKHAVFYIEDGSV